MGLEEADRQEERLGGRLAEDLAGGRRNAVHLLLSILTHLVEADHVGALGDVLLADQDRVVAGFVQRVHECW